MIAVPANLPLEGEMSGRTAGGVPSDSVKT